MRLPESLLVTPTLLRRFMDESVWEDGDGRHYGIMLRDDGNLIAHGPPDSKTPIPEQMIWAGDVLKKLNKELHHDGAWVVVFTHPKVAQLLSIFQDAKHCDYGRYALIWVDGDGDPQFTVEWMAGEGDLRDFDDVLLAGIVSTMNKCEAAWEMWHLHMRKNLDPKEGQTFKKAQGQQAPSTRH